MHTCGRIKFTKYIFK